MTRQLPLVVLALCVALASCRASCSCQPPAVPDGGADEASVDDAGATTTVVVSNLSDVYATVSLAVGSDSVVQPSSWAFCGVDAGLTCSFGLRAGGTQTLPTGGQYLNVSVAFNDPVGCGSTVGEVTANNANGFGTADVSLVNGVSHRVAIIIASADAGNQILVPDSVDGGSNAQALGVYPYGCDICVARAKPPCGIAACGSSPNDGGQGCGCKSGGQYNPAVPCQVTYQRAGAGSVVTVALVPGDVPAERRRR